jgi:ApaG protein
MFDPESIIIKVEPRYIEKQSSAVDNKYVFSYTITIINGSDDIVQLISRHWIIKDSNFKVEEVLGEGVVGDQPILKPDQGYQYTSGSVLETEVGTMEGFYHFKIGEQEELVNIPIPRFILSVPRQLH